MFYLYQITNLVNGKPYIGVTDDPHLRWWTHRNRASKDDRRILSRAMRKYGETQFSFEIMNSAETREEIYGLERLYISLLRSDHQGVGYNMTAGGMGGSQHPLYVKRMSAAIRALAADPVRGPAWRQKLSEGKLRAYAADPTYRTRVNKPGQFKGRTYSPEVIERMRLGARGRPPMPEEQRRQLSITRKGRAPYVMTDAIRQRMKSAAILRAQNPEAIRKMAESMRTSPKAKAARDNNVAKHTELMRSPEMRQAQSERARLAMTNPSRRQAQSDLAKRLWREGVCAGRPHSEEAKRKISESRKLSPLVKAAAQDPERRRKQSESLKTFYAQKKASA